MKHSEVGRKNDLGYMFGLMFSGSWCWFGLCMIASFTLYNFEITKASFFYIVLHLNPSKMIKHSGWIINLRTSSFQVVPAIRSPGSWLMSSEEDPKSWTGSLGHLIRLDDRRAVAHKGFRRIQPREAKFPWEWKPFFFRDGLKSEKICLLKLTLWKKTGLRGNSDFFLGPKSQNILPQIVFLGHRFGHRKSTI